MKRDNLYTLKKVSTPKTSFDHEEEVIRVAAQTPRNRDKLILFAAVFPYLVFRYVGEHILEFTSDVMLSAFGNVRMHAAFLCSGSHFVYQFPLCCPSTCGEVASGGEVL